MHDSPSDADDPRIEAVLARWFEQHYQGSDPDLLDLCDGDRQLAERVGGMLDRQQDLLDPVESRQIRRPLPFDRLGDYELKSRIGAGGMGEVYLAREVALDRMVALKVLRREFATDSIRRLRFRREALLMAALDHPGIVPIYGSGEDQGYVFLAMKLLPGTTMDRVGGTFEPRRMAKIGAQLARALHAAHEVEIVHRDIKPGNVQVDGDDAWVLDFGLARGRIDMTLTSEGEAPGTLAYMPPEQLRGDGSGFDPRGDIYSLGATLYHGVAGVPPFDEDTPEALVRTVLLQDPRRVCDQLKDRDFDTILQRALEKQPTRRFPTALAFAEDLERFAAGEPIESRPPSALSRGLKLVRRHRVVAASLLAAMLVAVVLVPQLWRNARERAAQLDRRFAVVQSAIDDERPAVALRRLRELRQDDGVRASVRFAAVWRLAEATLRRDAMLDRIQLDCVYRGSVLDEEFPAALQHLPDALREQPMTLLAMAFVQRERGDAAASTRLAHRLGATGACPRLVAALLAEREGRDPVAAATAAPTGTRAVDDHVFTAVLLRLVDAPQPAVDAEIEAALAVDDEHPRARLMVGVRHWIARDTRRAAEVFTLLLDRDRPRAELHVMMAQMANYDGEPERARSHLDRARLALAETGREPNRWLAQADCTCETILGRHDRAEELLDRARQRFGEDEWFALCRAHLLLERERYQQAYELLARLATSAEVPWNRRRAQSSMLQLEVDAAGDELTPARLQQLLERAEDLCARAAAVRDLATVAESSMVRAGLCYVMYEATMAAGDADLASDWEQRYWTSLERVVAIDDLHVDATFDMAQHVANQVLAFESGQGSALLVGDRAFAARRRAAELVRRARSDVRPPTHQLELAAFAALLSAAVGDRQMAIEMGAIARHLQRDDDDGDRAMQIRALLDRALAYLGRSDWPEPRDG
jgi:tetratricopeptide (TPR) repeat protein